MILTRSTDAGYLSNAYVVGDRPGGTAVAVDSGAPLAPLLEALEREKLTLAAVLCTHRHGDHVSGNHELARRTGALILASRVECPHVPGAVAIDGERTFGSLLVRPLPLPGHTAGQTGYEIAGVGLFTGDCLFKGSLGGTTAPGASGFDDARAAVLRILALPDATVLHPGHGPATTVGEERATNPFIRAMLGESAPAAGRCTALGRPAELIVLARDYDGGTKAWVRFDDDGADALVPGSRVVVVKIAFASDYTSPFLDGFVAGLARDLGDRGHEIVFARNGSVPSDYRLVFNVTDARRPRANYHRPTSSHFVCTLVENGSAADDLKKAAYGVLIRTMSNLVAYAVPESERPASYLVTPELGFREIPHTSGYVQEIAEQVLAISDVRFVLENDLAFDLPEDLRHGDAATASMARVGKRLESLGLLPAVLPLEAILAEHELRMLMKLFGIKQLSYGNLSARRDRDSFWMTGRGADKGNLTKLGRDILLVTGFDERSGRIRVRVPEGTDPQSRVSVDAVEHHGIYREFSEVGAILHLHAWLPGIASTAQSYPCGTLELAEEVLSLLRRAPDPANAVVGLRNHGITVTGPDLESILDTIEPHLERQVPMV